MWNLPIRETAAFAAACLLACAPAVTCAQADLSPRLQQSAEIIGHYFGDQRVLVDAAKLVAAELHDAPNSAPAWTQAAQIIIKGGHLAGPHFAPGTKQQYRALVDHALEIDPRYVPALSLKADIQFLTHDAKGGCESARKGMAIDPKFPWLHLAMAHCLDSEDRISDAIKEIDIVVKAGPGTTLYQRLAYPHAMVALAGHFAMPENADYLRELAARTVPILDPQDAWTLGEFANVFNHMEDYDDGIVYARKALAVMDYGVGRSFLIEALAGKVAHLKAAGLDDREILAQLRAARAAR